MRISVAEVSPHGAPLIVAIVPSKFTHPGAGAAMIERIQHHISNLPIMLVSIEDNGLRAYAPFQTHLLLVLIQLENLDLTVLDLNSPIPAAELPF